MDRRQLTTTQDVRAFALAGNATLTIVSKKTGARFTYRVRAPQLTMDGEPLAKEATTIWFASLLTGPDNEGDYRYFGNIKQRLSGPTYEHGKNAKIDRDAPGAKAFSWFWSTIVRGDGPLPAQLEVWHEGRCGRCGRKLTVPESIERGIGPECAGKVGFRAEAA